MTKFSKLFAVIVVSASLVLLGACSVTKNQNANKKTALKKLSVTLGARSNVDHGGFLDLKTGKIYTEREASGDQKNIDILYAWGRNSKKNLFSPRSKRSRVFGKKYKDIKNNWTVRNKGYFVNLGNGEDAQDFFKAASNRGDLIRAYVDGKRLVREYPNFKRSKNGPTLSIRHIEKGDVIAFKSNSRGVFFIGKVTDYEPGYKGSLSLDMKVSLYDGL